VQDIHIALSGLPRQEIIFASITGHGADEWQFNRAKNQYAAVLQRKANGSTADIFLDPVRVEKGREFCVKLTFEDQHVAEIYFPGGRADPNLRMPSAAMAVKWVGQNATDHVGTGPSVGPDGLRDVSLALNKLSKSDRVKSIRIEEPGGAKWTFGTNHEGHHNAEFVADPKDPSQGILYFQPDHSLAGKTLKIVATYESGKNDTATVPGGRVDAKLAMPAVASPKLSVIQATARWLGQDGSHETGPGDVHVVLSDLPTQGSIVGAVLSDGLRGIWVYRQSDRVKIETEWQIRPLVVKRGSGASSLDLMFPPYRDESKTSMTLRLIYASGSSEVVTLAGGPCDPKKLTPGPDRSEVAAKPGDNLYDLVARNGTIRLAKGTYLLDRPLVLEHAVALLGEPGAVLQFHQERGSAPWTTAIKIHSGGTTLKGFAVRFQGPIHWDEKVSYGPAVIGTTDSFDKRPDVPKRNLVFENLDLESPSARESKGWEEAIRLMRLQHAHQGRIVGNTLRGGYLEFFDGPWLVADNDYRGTPPSTFTPAVFAVHDPHDVIVRKNHARPVGPSGKTWRFLLFTNRGFGDVVENNVIEGIGPRDDDTISSMNMPEIVLTESYHLRFEGKPASISADGRVITIGALRGEPPRAGDVISSLSGSTAGQFRRIAMRIEPTVYLVEAPFSATPEIISISPGFVGDRYEGNQIDARDGRAAAGLVLAGNHFGTKVLDNRIQGAGDAMQLTAFPSESPGIWGWSHAPYLDGLIQGNLIEDSERGAQIGVMRNEATKSSKGRVYMTVTLQGNTVRWSDAFLSRRGTTARKPALVGITLGYPRSLDPGELRVTEKDDRLVAPGRAPAASAMKIEAAVVNGRAVTNKSFTLPLNLPTARVGDGGASPRR
jgi:hypothetical protein